MYIDGHAASRPQLIDHDQLRYPTKAVYACITFAHSPPRPAASPRRPARPAARPWTAARFPRRLGSGTGGASGKARRARAGTRAAARATA